MLEKKWRVLRDEKNVTHKTIVDELDFSTGLDDLFLLHEKRAQDRYIQSNFVTPEAKQFHRELGLAFLKEGILNLQILYARDTPISGIYGFNFKNKVSVYQTGFDPEWKKWSVGGVLWYLSIQKAFQDGFRDFDFLKGSESYKSLWTDTMRDEMHLTVLNTTPRALVYGAWNQLKDGLRWAKRRLPGV